LKGSWQWKDSTTHYQIMLNIYKDDKLSKYAGHSEPKRREDFKNGKYSLKKDSVLVINYDDNTTETCRISFVPKFGLTLIYGPNQGLYSNRKYILGKVIDKEVRANEAPPRIKN
jgi:hypothetical protein